MVTAISALDQTVLFDNVMLNFSNQTMATEQASSAVNVKSAVPTGYDFQITCNLPSGSDLTLGNGKAAHATAPGKGATIQ